MGEEAVFIAVEQRLRRALASPSPHAHTLQSDLSKLATILPSIDPKISHNYSRNLATLTDSVNFVTSSYNESTRSSLFSTTSPLRGRSSVPNTDDDATNIASTLSRTKRQMESELSRVAALNETIAADAKDLNAVSSEHDTLKNIMTSARGVIRALRKQDSAELIMMASASLFFSFAVLFILWSRLPLWPP